MRWIAIGVLLCGCTNELERPKPPDLSPVVQRYQQLDGTLDEESAPELVEALAEQATSLGGAEGIAELIALLFDDVGQSGQGLAVRRDALTVSGASLDGGAWAVYKRKCPGPGTDKQRGRIELTMLIDGDGLEPTVWGPVKQCLLAADGPRLDGDLQVDISGLLEETGNFLLRFEGDYTADGIARAVEFDAMIRGGDAVLTRHDLPGGGSFLIGVGLTDGTIRVVDSAGDWRCDANGCRGPGGAVVEF